MYENSHRIFFEANASFLLKKIFYDYFHRTTKFHPRRNSVTIKPPKMFRNYRLKNFKQQGTKKKSLQMTTFM